MTYYFIISSHRQRTKGSAPYYGRRRRPNIGAEELCSSSTWLKFDDLSNRDQQIVITICQRVKILLSNSTMSIL